MDIEGTSLWQDEGWQKKELSPGIVLYEGSYITTKKGAPIEFRGKIMQQHIQSVVHDGTVLSRERFEFHTCIQNPPPEIRQHPQGPCFLLMENNWFRLHYHRPPTHVDEAILHIKGILHEALNAQNNTSEITSSSPA